MQLLKANQIWVSKQKLLMLFSVAILIYLLLIIPLNVFVLLCVKGRPLIVSPNGYVVLDLKVLFIEMIILLGIK